MTCSKRLPGVYYGRTAKIGTGLITIQGFRQTAKP